MPLFHGKSKKAFEHNLKTEYEEGKPLKQSLAIAYAMKKRSKKMAHGGDVERAMKEDDRMLNQHGEEEQGPNEAERTHEPDRIIEHSVMNQHEDEDMDMVDHIMKSRQKHFSKGGEVANSDMPEADFEKNEFDDLHLRDSLEEHETEANSGDDLSDSREDMDRKDMISMIMRSRRKKDKMPKPM